MGSPPRINNLLDRRNFRTEDQLVRIIVQSRQYLPAGFRRSHAKLLVEFDCSVGRADLIFYSLRKDWRKHIKYGHIPPSWLFPLRVLPYRKHFSTTEFTLLTGVTKKRALQALAQYQRLGYCKRVGKSSLWVKCRQPIPIVKKIIAVEAKLTNWKRALFQAYRYLEYSSQTWVILDSATARGAINNRAAFKRLNVGLLVISKAGIMKTYVRPAVRSPKVPLRFWEANGIIAGNLLRKSKLHPSLASRYVL